MHAQLLDISTGDLHLLFAQRDKSRSEPVYHPTLYGEIVLDGGARRGGLVSMRRSTGDFGRGAVDTSPGCFPDGVPDDLRR